MIMTVDIGGTKTLWTIWQKDEPIARDTCPTANINDFSDFLKTQMDDFISAHPGAEITRLVFALAGPVTENIFSLTNTGQTMDLVQIREDFAHIPEIIFLNDLEALAHSIDHLNGPDQLAVFRSTAHAKTQTSGSSELSKPAGAKAVLSIGTGLGISAVSREGIVIPSEGGHIDFAPIGEKQQMIYEKLAVQYGHVSYERLLSGQGLSNIFSCILEEDADSMACRPRQNMHPAQITALARSGNKTALEAFHIFTEILGAACGNYALVYNASGGIYLGGGMMPKILPLIDKKAFENAFTNKGRFKDFLNDIPVYVILDETAPSIGAMECC